MVHALFRVTVLLHFGGLSREQEVSKVRKVLEEDPQVSRPSVEIDAQRQRVVVDTARGAESRVKHTGVLITSMDVLAPNAEQAGHVASDAAASARRAARWSPAFEYLELSVLPVGAAIGALAEAC